jgi:hypothetical protein
LVSSVWADSESLNDYKTITMLDGDWVLSPADVQEGGAIKKGPAAELMGIDGTAISFKVVGKGSAVQENLLPGAGKEMVTMYHCDKFKTLLASPSQALLRQTESTRTDIGCGHVRRLCYCHGLRHGHLTVQFCRRPCPHD